MQVSAEIGITELAIAADSAVGDANSSQQSKQSQHSWCSSTLTRQIQLDRCLHEYFRNQARAYGCGVQGPQIDPGRRGEGAERAVSLASS